MVMDTSNNVSGAAAYQVRLEQVAQNQSRAEGAAAVQLIRQARPLPPIGGEGQGSNVNTYA